MGVKLNHFVARPLADVGHVNLNGDGFACPRRRRVDAQVAELEARYSSSPKPNGYSGVTLVST